MKYFLFFLLCVLQVNLNAQIPVLNWAGQIGGSSSSYTRINSVSKDSSGNIFVAGYFSGTFDADFSANTFQLSSAGGTDIFVAK